jgi:hypothetical protein
LRNSTLKFFKISIYPHVKNSHSLTLEKQKKFAKNPKTIQSKKLKICQHVFTQGTFLLNYRKIYQSAFQDTGRDAGTDGQTSGRT